MECSNRVPGCAGSVKSNVEDSVIVVGGGAAGLAAANVLSLAGLDVSVLEARDRLGGRILTLRSNSFPVPVELGAEFIHGAKNATWNIVRAARFKTDEVPDCHWQMGDEGWLENRRFWKDLESVISKIKPDVPDQDVETFLGGLRGVSADAKWLLKEYVEGFHAAPIEEMSAHAVAASSESSDREEGARQFRLCDGNSRLIEYLRGKLTSRGVPLHLETVVKGVEWEAGQVEIKAVTPAGSTSFSAARAIITLPLGVLKQTGPWQICFNPELTQKQQAISDLGLGKVVKLVMAFREQFWPKTNFGFIHSEDEWLPTWWSDSRAPILTGWAGGRRGRYLAFEESRTITEEGIRALASIFQLSAATLRDKLAGTFLHDWNNDPFSRGAYSFTTVGNASLSESLARPLKNSLFFAGEATAPTGQQGTVHAALESGRRAAYQLLATLPRKTPHRIFVHSA